MWIAFFERGRDMHDKTFGELEHAGWMAKADAYDDLFATITRQAIDPVLGSLRPLAGKRLLDVACGPGYLAGAAADEGATCKGVDFASSMIEVARRRFPEVEFAEGSAEALPFADASFDAVTCAFGLLHLERPEVAVKEASRVLERGGTFTYTTWVGPDRGGEFFDLVMGAIRKHGTLDVPLPPSPPVFHLADPVVSNDVMSGAGFTDLETSVLPLSWQASESREILDLIYESIVRVPMLIEAQADDARDPIHREIIDGAERLRVGDSIRIEFPALMATGRKP